MSEHTCGGGMRHGWLTATNWVQRDCLTCRLVTLEAENERLTKERDEARAHSFRVKELHAAEDGRWSFSAGGEDVKVFWEQLVQLFVELGGKNYLESKMSMSGPDADFVFTMQKVGAKSPHDLMKEQEARAETAEAERDALTRQLERTGGATVSASGQRESPLESDS